MSIIWRQVLADVLNCEIRTLRQRDGFDETVLGAASFGLGKEMRSSTVKDDSSMWISVLPDAKEATKHEFYFTVWLKAVTSLKDITFTLPTTL